MTLETIIAHFGYAGLAIGLLIEGETFLVLGAFLAHRGYLSLPLVIATGMIVVFSADQFFFWTGRIKGRTFIANRPSWKPKVEKASALLHRNVYLVTLGFRFMYGLRTVIPFVLGMSEVKARTFILLDFVAALVWSLLFGMAGYLFGQVAEAVLETIQKYELWIALGIFVVGSIIWLYPRYSKHYRKKAHTTTKSM
jgi:membrane protein DedA with SNARE-associated domain